MKAYIKGDKFVMELEGGAATADMLADGMLQLLSHMDNTSTPLHDVRVYAASTVLECLVKRERDWK